MANRIPAHGKMYDLWRDMHRRCYSAECLERKPTYAGCTVCEAWHDFQAFAAWAIRQPNYGRKGFQLDKDLMVQGNKIYGPEFCSFVPFQINSMMKPTPNDGAERLSSGSFRARLLINSIRVDCGTFKDRIDAIAAYRKAKKEYVIKQAVGWHRALDIRVYLSLLQWEFS